MSDLLVYAWEKIGIFSIKETYREGTVPRNPTFLVYLGLHPESWTIICDNYYSRIVSIARFIRIIIFLRRILPYAYSVFLICLCCINFKMLPFTWNVSGSHIQKQYKNITSRRVTLKWKKNEWKCKKWAQFQPIKRIKTTIIITSVFYIHVSIFFFLPVYKRCSLQTIKCQVFDHLMWMNINFLLNKKKRKTQI